MSSFLLQKVLKNEKLDTEGKILEYHKHKMSGLIQEQLNWLQIEIISNSKIVVEDIEPILFFNQLVKYNVDLQGFTRNIMANIMRQKLFCFIRFFRESEESRVMLDTSYCMEKFKNSDMKDIVFDNGSCLFLPKRRKNVAINTLDKDLRLFLNS